MGYAIVVYDISNNEARNKVKEVLNRYLYHVQKSVFEGKITESQLFYLKKFLPKLINPETDYIIIYLLPDRGYLKEKVEIGKKKEETKIL